jgi:hypothetical protein
MISCKRFSILVVLCFSWINPTFANTTFTEFQSTLKAFFQENPVEIVLANQFAEEFNEARFDELYAAAPEKIDSLIHEIKSFNTNYANPHLSKDQILRLVVFGSASALLSFGLDYVYPSYCKLDAPAGALNVTLASELEDYQECLSEENAFAKKVVIIGYLSEAARVLSSAVYTYFAKPIARQGIQGELEELFRADVHG